VDVQCFGGLRVSAALGGQTVEGAAAGYQPWAILAFLAAQPDGAASTEALCTAIWPDVDPDHAAVARLSPALSRLRRGLQAQVPELSGPVVVRGRNGYCSLDPDAVISDVQRFVRLCERARRLPPDEATGAYEAALALYRALYRGDLLARQAYEWVERRERDGLTPLERYQRLYHAATCELADLYRRRGEAARAVPLFRQVLAGDPTAEDVARTLFRCYVQLGDRPALLREFQRLRQCLRRALLDPGDDPDPAEDDAVFEPEAETVAVYEEALAALERGAAGGTAESGATEYAAG
jgi:DNA-binding SARP family transcriptional activator